MSRIWSLPLVSLTVYPVSDRIRPYPELIEVMYFMSIRPYPVSARPFSCGNPSTLIRVHFTMSPDRSRMKPGAVQRKEFGIGRDRTQTNPNPNDLLTTAPLVTLQIRMHSAPHVDAGKCLSSINPAFMRKLSGIGKRAK